MEKYVTPEMELVVIETEDIILNSQWDTEKFPFEAE